MIETEKTGKDFAENVTTGRIQCRRCCMDKSAEEITFDDKGVCNFCHQADKALAEIAADVHNLGKHLMRIRKDGEGKKYDCIIGLSGGVDSSMTLYHAVKLGLRPLCFSVDNGWNNPLADENIMKLVEGLKVPFYRYVIDRKKFVNLQMSFIKAGVPNIEIPTDHILMAATYELARQYGIKWILSGGNVATESIMPPSWGYNARDLVHINDIYTKMTGKKLTGLPTCSLLQYNIYKWVHRIKTFYLLDYIDYHRQESIELLEREFGWTDYGGKHEESFFTSWFQNYYLFEKFGFDKRKPHLSSLIASGQLTRQQALYELSKDPVYPQLGLEERVMQYPKRSHDSFQKDERLFNFIGKIIKVCRF